MAATCGDNCGCGGGRGGGDGRHVGARVGGEEIRNEKGGEGRRMEGVEEEGRRSGGLKKYDVPGSPASAL